MYAFEYTAQASIRRNPFETTEPGITLTADSLKQERLDRRFDELKKPPEFTIPDFQAMHEASARRWEERQAAAMQEALSNLHQGAGTGHATSPVTGNV